jgi:tetratricopeptide (TPR) repeat protein
MSIQWKTLLILFAFMLAEQPSAESATLRGRLFLDQEETDQPIEVVLKKGRRVIARVVPDDANNYEFEDLANGRYELVIRLKKRETKRRIDLFCGPDSISVIDINLDQNDININISVPIEDPIVVDVTELRRDYPDNVLREFEKARKDARNGDFGRAAERLLRILNIEPDFYSARVRLGMVYQAMACYPEAEKQFLRAKELSPNVAQSLVNLAGLYIGAADARLDDGRYYLSEAIAILKEAILARPSSSIAYCLLGAAYFKTQSFEIAEESLNKSMALGIKSYFPEARLMLANVYIQQKKWEDAIEQLDGYLRENPFGQDRRKIEDLREEIKENLKPNEK